MKKIKVQPLQESFEEVATEVSLREQLISDLTGLATYDVNRAPSAVWELASHLLDCGWTKKVLILIFLLGSLAPIHADETYANLSKEFNQVYQEILRNKVEKLPKRAIVEVFLKDGTSVKGTFLGFQKYDDSVWIHPSDSHWGFFSDKAFDIRQIKDVSSTVVRPI